MPTSAGMMDSRVRLQWPNPTQDKVGQELPTWTTYDTVWAQVRALSARERHVGQQQGSTTDAEITFRIPTPSGRVPTAKDRALDADDRIYRFDGPIPTTRSGEVTFRATMQDPEVAT